MSFGRLSKQTLREVVDFVDRHDSRWYHQFCERDGSDEELVKHARALGWRPSDASVIYTHAGLRPHHIVDHVYQGGRHVGWVMQHGQTSRYFYKPSAADENPHWQPEDTFADIRECRAFLEGNL